MPDKPSVSERNWPTQVFSPISVAAVTGIVTVPSTKFLKVNQDVEIRFAGQPVLKLTVREVLDETALRLGPLESPFKADPTIPDQLAPYNGGTLTVPEQERSPIQPSIIDRAVYEEAPTVAVRTVAVDWLGRFYATDNPLPVRLTDGSVNIGTVNAELEVQLSHQDNVPNPGDVADSVRVGDGVRTLVMNSDGSVPVKEVGPSRTVFVFGANPEHVIDIRQVIWDHSTNYVFPAVAEFFTVASDNANDTAAGTGARSVTISGLDANYEEIEEEIALNGTVPVSTTKQFLRRNRIQVTSVGSSGINLGNIHIDGSTTMQGFIASGVGRDRSVVFTVPAGYTGKLKQIFCSVGPSQRAAGVKYGDLDIMVREFQKPFRFTNLGYIMSNGTQFISNIFGDPRDFPEKTDMALVFTTEKEGTASQGFFEIYLEPVL